MSTAPARTTSGRGALFVAEYRLRNMWKWRGSILAFGLGNPVLYLASVGLGVGMLVDANSPDGVGGVPYLVFLAPALLATAAIQGGMDEVTFPTLAGLLWNRLFFSIRATSVTGAQIAEGVLLASAARVLFTSTMYWLVLWAFGAVEWTTALPLIAVSTGAGVCWAAFILAIAANVTDDGGFLAHGSDRDHAHVPVLWDLLPAVEPSAGRAVDRLDLPALARHRTRSLAVLRPAPPGLAGSAEHRVPPRPGRGRHRGRPPQVRTAADRMITQAFVTSAAVAIAERRAGRPGAGVYAGRSHTVLQRGFLALRTSNALAFFTGFVEPVLFLVAFGYGVGGLVGTVTVDGVEVPYAAFIAPALLAASAMNGALFDSTFNVFFKMHHLRLYHAMMATSLGPLDVALGEIGWAMIRGAAYAVGFLTVITLFGLTTTWWALLLVPAAVLVAFAFAAIGMSLTSYMTSFQQLNWLNFWLLPIFLFSGTFYPITNYPEWLQAVIQVTPLWQAIAMMRGIMFGVIDAALLVHVAYFAVIAVIGLFATSRRLEALFLR